MANEKLFKGILQYKSTDTFTKQAGYIYFVREMSGDTPTGNAEIYFGTRKYGDIQATQLKALEDAISANSKDIEAIEAKLGEWTENLGTVASAVVAVSGATQTNATDIKNLQDSLAEGGATAAAIASAQTAADNAQKGVDAIKADYLKSTDKTELQGNIDEKLAISDFEAYSAATKTAYEKVASDEADAAEAAAKAYVDAISADTRLEALEAISADTRLDALESDTHTHSNKALLDTYTQTEANLADAVAKKHEHTNKIELDKIAEGDKAKWDKATSDIDAFLKGEAISGSTVDTLKEIQNYITSDGQAAADMLSAIASAQTAADNAQDAADNAQGEVDALEGVVSALTDTVATKVAQADYDVKVAELDGKITAETKARQEAITGLQSTLQTEIGKKVAQDDYDVKVAELDGKITAETKARQDAFAAAETATTQAISTAKQEAITSATTYADNLAKNYDASGSAAAVEAKLTAYTAATDSTLSGLRTDVNAVSGATEGLKTSKLDVSAFNDYSGATANTLAQIQSDLAAASAAAVKNVTAADASVVVSGDNADKKVAVKLSSIEGNMIALKEDGLYAAMYYGGDDVE